MEFMQTYYRKDLTEAARKTVGSDAVGAFAQLDTWTTHVLVVIPSGSDGFEVAMFEVDNEAKGQPPSAEDMAEAIENWFSDEEAVYPTLGEALDNVTGGYSETIENLPETLQKALSEHQEAEALEGMSKYARKKYLQQKALEAEETSP